MKYKKVKSRSVKPCPICGKPPKVYVWNMRDGWYDVVIRCKHNYVSCMTNTFTLAYIGLVRYWNYWTGKGGCTM